MSDQAERLRALAELSRGLAGAGDLDGLVREATRRARELFEAEGCALLLLDPSGRQFRFPVASQGAVGAASAAQLSDLHVPVERGIAGWVFRNDQSALVADTASDARFYDAVDRRTAMHTRSLLCAPLRTRAGNIGVIEVVNPGAAYLTEEALEFLDVLASEIGVAYERADLTQQLTYEVIDLRRFCGRAGVALSGLGVLLALAATLYHRARVLPWAELPTRRGVLIGLLCVTLGALLVGVGRGWLVKPRAGNRPS